MKYQVERWQQHRWQRDDGRYYCVYIEQDLLGEWMVRCYWGGKQRPASRMLVTACDNHKHAVERLSIIASRRQYRHYTII